MSAVTLVAVVALALSAAPAGAAVKAQLAEVSVGGDTVVWQPRIADYERLVLSVSGPGGWNLRQEFETGVSPVLSMFDAAGFPLADGVYKYELVATPRVDAATRARMAAAREAGDDSIERQLRSEGVLPAGHRQSGAFSIRDGAFVPSDLREAAPGPKSPAQDSLVSAPGPGPDYVVLTNGDGVIRNSLCVGFDCPDAPIFDDSTILLMENNTRIKFGDTSNSPFPNNDWEIEANSNLSGGLSYLGFNDCGTADNDGGCAADLVFAVEANADASSLYVDTSRRIGVGTNIPVLNFHIVTGNTPAIRLDQDGSSGFSAQVWDIAGNEANFFVRDVTGGSRLPLRIRPQAPTSSIDIAADGDIGIGTAAPVTGASVDIRKSQPLLHFQDLEDGAQGWAFGNSANGTQFLVSKDGTGGTEVTVNQRLDGAGAATLVVSGSVQATNVAFPSSRALKEDFQPVDAEAILAKVAGLPISEWRFREGAPVRHIGPVAEDFQTAFASVADGKHISMMDANGIALAAIQGLKAENDRMRSENAELESRLAALEQMVRELPGGAPASASPSP